MNTGCLLGAVAAVGVVRVILNFLFYGVLMTPKYAAIAAAHPGITREVIPAYVIADLIFALIFVLLFAKVASCLGGGVKGGIVLGIFVAILSPLLFMIYSFYSFTIFPADLAVTESGFQLVSHVISGALAGAIYKS